jgi:mono/diheme cytochrome c family protein
MRPVRLTNRTLAGAMGIVVCGMVSACGRDTTTAPEPSPPAARVVYQPRQLTNVTYERTAERRTRGQYLVEGPLQCLICHSERDWTKRGAPPKPGRAGAGAVWWDKPWLVAHNLTPDPETGVGRWTDDMLVRAIREGVAHDGRPLHPQMWSGSFSRLSDEDVAAVVVFLRSMKPVNNPLPATTIPPDQAARLRVPKPIDGPVAPPDQADPLSRGRYLASIADCSGCHTSWYTPRNPGLFAGGNLIERVGLKTYSTNITRDASGLAHYDRGLFREVIRTGKLRAREISPLMPWIAFRHLNDADLDALFDYLAAYRPAKHTIDNVNAPALCAICGGTHPLGQYNRQVDATPVPVRLDEVRDAVGRYRFEDGFELSFAIENGKFVGRVGDRPRPSEMTTTDGRVFDWDVDHVEFIRDAQGRVTGLINNRADPARKIR